MITTPTIGQRVRVLIGNPHGYTQGLRDAIHNKIGTVLCVASNCHPACSQVQFDDPSVSDATGGEMGSDTWWVYHTDLDPA